MNKPSDKEQKLKRGDIVLNGYGAPGVNDLFLIVGSASRKTGKFSTTRYYECRMLYQDKLRTDKSLFSKHKHKLVKIGHVDFDAYITAEMLKARALAPTNPQTEHIKENE